MQLAIKLITNHRNVGADTTEDLKDYRYQSILTQRRKWEQSKARTPCILEAFNKIANDFFVLPTEKKALRKRVKLTKNVQKKLERKI